MARGWESKEVEMQIESAQDRLQHTRTPVRTPEQIAFEREQESIELSRRRVLEDMAAASNPKYRELLQRSLDFLDAKLARLRAGADPEKHKCANGS
jgi:molecular chaperone GrpE (heat shock protein)